MVVVVIVVVVVVVVIMVMIVTVIDVVAAAMVIMMVAVVMMIVLMMRTMCLVSITKRCHCSSGVTKPHPAPLTTSPYTGASDVIDHHTCYRSGRGAVAQDRFCGCSDGRVVVVDRSDDSESRLRLR